MAAAANAPAHRRRKQEHLRVLNHSPNLGRFAVTNHLRREVARLAPHTGHPLLEAFLPQNLLPWIGDYLKNALTPRHPFPDYTGSAKNGVYPIAPAPGANAINMAIAGDWGTGTDEAQKIMNLMVDFRPDFTIHLGDIYYVGDESEVGENFLGQPRYGFQGVKWQPGNRGGFSLNGNHEMYANGRPYFTTILKNSGMLGDAEGQVASFFCLESEYWRILAIDTGYNSVGVPILSQIPGINNIPAIGGDCHLESKLIQWLRDVVKPQANPKATLLLSHHQYFSAFGDKAYTKPAKQLLEFFGNQEILWIWGHEHRMAIYGKSSVDGGITAYGRCVGHGGMPVETGSPDSKKAPIQFYDPRSHTLADNHAVGENGFVMVMIHGPTLTLDYRDIRNEQLLLEQFTPGANGALAYQLICNNKLQPPPAA